MTMKKWLCLGLLALGSFSLWGCGTTTTSEELGYEDFDDIDTFAQIWTRPESSGDYLVYLYSKDCESCEDLKAAMFAFATDYAEEFPVYFLDITDVGSTDTDAQTNFLDVTGIDQLVYPALVLVKNKSFDSTAQSRFYFAGATRIRSILYDMKNGINPFED